MRKASVKEFKNRLSSYFDTDGRIKSDIPFNIGGCRIFSDFSVLPLLPEESRTLAESWLHHANFSNTSEESFIKWFKGCFDQFMYIFFGKAEKPALPKWIEQHLPFPPHKLDESALSHIFYSYIYALGEEISKINGFEYEKSNYKTMSGVFIFLQKFMQKKESINDIFEWWKTKKLQGFEHHYEQIIQENIELLTPFHKFDQPQWIVSIIKVEINRLLCSGESEKANKVYEGLLRVTRKCQLLEKRHLTYAREVLIEILPYLDPISARNVWLFAKCPLRIGNNIGANGHQSPVYICIADTYQNMRPKAEQLVTVEKDFQQGNSAESSNSPHQHKLSEQDERLSKCFNQFSSEAKQQFVKLDHLNDRLIGVKSASETYLSKYAPRCSNYQQYKNQKQNMPWYKWLWPWSWPRKNVETAFNIKCVAADALSLQSTYENRCEALRQINALKHRVGTPRTIFGAIWGIIRQYLGFSGKADQLYNTLHAVMPDVPDYIDEPDKQDYIDEPDKHQPIAKLAFPKSLDEKVATATFQHKPEIPTIRQPEKESPPNPISTNSVSLFGKKSRKLSPDSRGNTLTTADHQGAEIGDYDEKITPISPTTISSR